MDFHNNNLDDLISQLSAEVESVQSSINQSKSALETSDLLSTLVAREMEREHWATEVEETKKLLENQRRQLEESANSTETEVDLKSDIKGSLKMLKHLDLKLALAKEKENVTRAEMAIAEQKIQDLVELKCNLETKVVKIAMKRKILVMKQERSSLPPYTYLSLSESETRHYCQW